MAINPRLGKVLYAILFCALLPFLLILWANNVEVPIAVGDWRIAGIALSLGGLMLIIRGMYDLWHYGQGLPMNGYPPQVYVQSGAYRIFNHPIYVGFCLVCAGVSCWFNSSSGLFLITPIVILGCWALVMGYELPDLKKRFGEKYQSKGLFSLIGQSAEAPTFSEKFGSAIAVFLPWFLLYELFVYLDVPDYFLETSSSLEKSWRVWGWAEIPYGSIYVFVAAAPFIQKTKTELRNFMLDAWWTTAIGSFLLLVFPFYVAQRPMQGESILISLIQWEREVDSMAAAFPSFHVIWALVTAAAWSRAIPKWKWFWWLWAVLISASCSATGNHSIADIAAGIVVVILVINREKIWKLVQSLSETLANSWNSFQIGPFRVINHSLYAGLAGFVGVFWVAQFMRDQGAIVLVTSATLLGGAVWGQFAEGSSIMLRPFGYYGAIAGGVLGTLISYFFLGTSLTALITAFALASPVIQAIGRLRCLVQGCCHGAITSGEIGIVYRNEHSRVCKISGMKGAPVHNTQLYSIIGNMIAAVVLWRLWYGGASASLLIGLYFILNGVARFVEEAYRGEIQTKVFMNLRLYQWLAIAFIIVGACVTTIPTSTPIVFQWRFNWETVGISLVGGFLSAFAMGIDFPKSKIPFSRLTG